MNDINLDFENTRRDLHHRGSAAGWHTEDGHTCSNLIQQLEAMRTYVRPEWATDIRQTLPWMIQQQMKRLGLRAV
jgi:hypothetical protein